MKLHPSKSDDKEETPAANRKTTIAKRKLPEPLPQRKDQRTDMTSEVKDEPLEPLRGSSKDKKSEIVNDKSVASAMFMNMAKSSQEKRKRP